MQTERLASNGELSMAQENSFSRRHFLASAAVTIGAVGFGMTASAKTRSGVRGELASHRRNDVAQLTAADCCCAGQKSLPGRLLDILLHQLATPTSLRAGVGRKMQRSRIVGRRRTRARVLI